MSEDDSSQLSDKMIDDNSKNGENRSEMTTTENTEIEPRTRNNEQHFENRIDNQTETENSQNSNDKKENSTNEDKNEKYKEGKEEERNEKSDETESKERSPEEENPKSEDEKSEDKSQEINEKPIAPKSLMEIQIPETIFKKKLTGFTSIIEANKRNFQAGFQNFQNQEPGFGGGSGPRGFQGFPDQQGNQGIRRNENQGFGRLLSNQGFGRQDPQGFGGGPRFGGPNGNTSGRGMIGPRGQPFGGFGANRGSRFGGPTQNPSFSDPTPFGSGPTRPPFQPQGFGSRGTANRGGSGFNQRNGFGNGEPNFFGEEPKQIPIRDRPSFQNDERGNRFEADQHHQHPQQQHPQQQHQQQQHPQQHNQLQQLQMAAKRARFSATGANTEPFVPRRPGGPVNFSGSGVGDVQPIPFVKEHAPAAFPG